MTQSDVKSPQRQDRAVIKNNRGLLLIDFPVVVKTEQKQKNGSRDVKEDVFPYHPEALKNKI